MATPIYVYLKHLLLINKDSTVICSVHEIWQLICPAVPSLPCPFPLNTLLRPTHREPHADMQWLGPFPAARGTGDSAVARIQAPVTHAWSDSLTISRKDCSRAVFWIRKQLCMTVRLFCFWSMVAVELECDDDISKTDQLGETICLFSRQRDQILERVAVIDHVACLIRGRGEVPTQIRLQPTDYSTRLGPSCTTSRRKRRWLTSY